MRIFLAMIVTPSLALGLQSLLYSLVTPSCAHQSRVWIHGSAALALALGVVFTAMAWSEWTVRAASLPGTPDSDEPDPRSARRFLAAVATAIAALSSLVMLMMWVATWVLSPCSEL